MTLSFPVERVDEGTGERWRPMPGHPAYQVSDFGRVKNPEGRFIGRPNHSKGYWRVSIEDHAILQVHLLVLEAFVEPRPPGGRARFRDGDPSNCRFDNLRWIIG